MRLRLYFSIARFFSFTGGRVLKQAVAIAAAAAKKKAAFPKKADAVVPSAPSKRPRQEVEPVNEAPRSQKRMKMLAKKGEREVHLITSQTTEETVSNDLPSTRATQERPTPVSQPSEASPALGVVEPSAAPIIPEVVESPVAAPVGGPAVPVHPTATIPELAAERQSPQRPRRTATVLEEV